MKRLVTQPLSSACALRYSTDPCLLRARVQSIPSLGIPTQGYFSHALNHRPLFKLCESVYDKVVLRTLCALCITHVGMFVCWHDSITYLHVVNSKAFLFLTRHVVLVDSSSHCSSTSQTGFRKSSGNHSHLRRTPVAEPDNI